jgi:hypothetical protein
MMKMFLLIAMKNLYYMIPVYVVCIYIVGRIKKSKDLHHLHHIALKLLIYIHFLLVKMFNLYLHQSSPIFTIFTKSPFNKFKDCIE